MIHISFVEYLNRHINEVNQFCDQIMRLGPFLDDELISLIDDIQNSLYHELFYMQLRIGHTVSNLVLGGGYFEVYYKKSQMLKEYGKKHNLIIADNQLIFKDSRKS